MGDVKAAGRRPLWMCPSCGARLVSRNLWHSCGQWTLESLFSNSTPATLDVARLFVAMLQTLGDVQVIPQKTRLVCVARVRFAGLYPKRNDFLATFALRRWLDSRRIIRKADYGPRWRAHYMRVATRDEIDDELRAWLQEAHDTVGLQEGIDPEASA